MKIKQIFAAGMGLLWAFTGAAQSLGTLTSGGLLEPQGVVVDVDNNLYITDSGNNRVARFFPDTGILANFAGLTGFAGTNDGKGSLARFSSPQGIVLARGGVVVADSANHTIRLITLEGVVRTLAGQPGLPGAVDSPGGANTARFRFPAGLAADALGNIFVADTKNSAIRKIGLDGSVTTLANAASGLYEPAGVAMWTNGLLLVADTRNHSIKSLAPDGTLTLVSGSNSRFGSGADDALFAENATFSNPRGVLWLGPEAGIVVSDSGNHTLRRLFYNDEVLGFSVETFAGSAGQPGAVNGLLKDARLNSPAGLAADSLNTGFVIADLANNAIRRVQRSPIQPAVGTPRIGWVEYVFNEATGRSESRLRTVTSEVFNNDVPIAILGEAQTTTRFTSAATSTNLLTKDVPPDPTKFSTEAPPYKDGLLVAEAEPLYIRPDPIGPDVTVKAIGTHNERRSSPIISARFVFKVANPAIQGENPAQFKISTTTVGGRVFYTTDGSDPIPDVSLSPEPDGTIRLKITDSDIVFKAQAFRANYQNSQVISNTFYATNYLPNLLAFGFAGSTTNKIEASSDFVAQPGQRFFAPVTLSLLPAQSIYSLQFSLFVTNLNASPAINGGSLGFESMLKRALPGTPPTLLPLPPSMATDGAGASTNLTSLLATNVASQFLGVGWFERLGGRVLYDSSSQDLISYSQVHETVFRKLDRKVVLGALSFVVPTTAPVGSQYQVDIRRPSATTFNEDGVSSDTFIDLPLKGSLGLGAVNARKQITVAKDASRSYLVGDLAPFYWLNAGDFGDSRLLNQDIVQIFNAVSYQVNQPPQGSDYFDAMDACCNTAPGTASVARVAPLPVGLALVDLNADKILDLITVSRTDDSLTVRLGVGDGSFSAGVRYPLGVGTFRPANLFLFDVNGDGKTDIVCPTTSASTVTIHFGNGDGSFSTASAVVGGAGTASEPVSAGFADFNGDGIKDFVFANQQAGSVTVLTNNASGDFFVRGEYQTGSGSRSGPSALRVTDFDGDGVNDVVTANAFDGTVSVLRGTTGGALVKLFDEKVGNSSLSSPSDLALADLDGDGRLDIVTANSVEGSITVLLRTATAFQPAVNYKAGAGASALALADVNGDGKTDVVVANGQANTVQVFLNQGSGTLVAPLSFVVGSSPSRVSIGDLNGDGKPDLAVACSADGIVSLLLGDGSGNFAASSIFSSEVFDGAKGGSINRIAYGDGVLDVNDLYVSFRRSLDPTLSWFRRSWVNGARSSSPDANVSRSGAPSLAADVDLRSSVASAPVSAQVRMDRMQAVAGQALVLPVQLDVQGGAPVRFVDLNIDVIPLDDAPPLIEQVRVFPDAAFGPATFTTSQGIGNVAFACLNEGASGISKAGTLAKLRVMVPAGAGANHSYMVRLTRASVSTDGLSVVPTSTISGIIVLGTRDLSSLGDGIPDSWRLQYFGSLDSAQAAANADPDRDGVSNYNEYLAGTNPNEVVSALRIRLSASKSVSGQWALLWDSTTEKQYSVETSTSLSGGVWTAVSTQPVLGNGSEVGITLPMDSTIGPRFFRVRLISR